MNPIEIRALRLGLNYTQARLGLWVGVHASSVGRWERGRHRPRPRHIERLRLLGRDVNDAEHSEAGSEAAIERAGEPPDPVAADRVPKASARPSRSADRARPKRTISRTISRAASSRRTAQHVAIVRSALSARVVAKGVQGRGWELHHGDLFDVVPTLAPGSFDALIVDLPYSSGGLHIGTKQQSTRRKYQGSGVQLRR